MLWLKAAHIIFAVTWFAGLFYLPRLFVYHCETMDAPGHARFCTMERRLYRLMSIGMAGSLLMGVWLWLAYWPIPTAWLHAKAALALGLVGYHHWLLILMKDFANFRNKRSAKFYRLINEVPAIFLIALVCLAVLKPG
ncbi:MAG: CopD family protein [Pseudomonadota bacterium]